MQGFATSHSSKLQRACIVHAGPLSSRCSLRSPARHVRCHAAAEGQHAVAPQQDVLLRSLSDMGEVAVLVVDGTQLVADAVRRHNTSPTASAAFGRTLLGTLLMACFRKEQEVTQVSFKGDGPLGSVMALADTYGNVKGKMDNPSADPPLREDGKLNVGAAVGSGVLAIVRSHPLEPQPYTGIVPIVSGEIAEDLATYLVDSEQTNSALGLGVCLSRDCSIRSAGGFLVQILPFCSDETLTQLEQNLLSLPTVTDMLNQGLGAEGVTERILAGLGVAPGSSTSIVPKYGPCDSDALRQRMRSAVASLGRAEVLDIVKTEGKIEVTCEMCQDSYVFEQDDILQLINERALEKAERALEEAQN